MPEHLHAMRSGADLRSNVLYISRFADATLQWPSEGVAVTMSHDYLSFHDKARVSLLVQTLEHEHWEGTLQVGRKSCRFACKEASRPKGFSLGCICISSYMLCGDRFASRTGSVQHHNRVPSTALCLWAERSCASSHSCRRRMTYLYWIIALQMVWR